MCQYDIAIVIEQDKECVSVVCRYLSEFMILHVKSYSGLDLGKIGFLPAL